MFGPDTPPKTPNKPESDTSWQRETVKAQLRAKSKKAYHSSPKKSRSSSRRSGSSSKQPNPYVKLTRLDGQEQHTSFKLRNTKEDAGEAAAQSQDKTAEPAALASPTPRGLTSPPGTPEPEEKRAKSKRVAHTPRLKF